MACLAQSSTAAALVDLDRPASAISNEFPIAANGQAAAIYVAPQNPETVRVAAEAFASDVERVTGVKPRLLTSLAAPESRSTACSALWARCVRPSFIFAIRACSSIGLFHSLFDVRFLRLRSNNGSAASMHKKNRLREASANRGTLNVG